MEGLPRLEIQRRTGAERFLLSGAEAGFDLLSFWQWASSDLTSNVLRGILAEYLVARAVGATGSVRDPWQAYDLTTDAGLTIEVKSGSYLQTWWQKTHTDVVFLIPPTRSWNPDDNTPAETQQRQADLYIFALLAHRDKTTLDPLELEQWEFYLVRTSVLNEVCGRAKSVGLKRLRKLPHVQCSYRELASAVRGIERDVRGTG